MITQNKKIKMSEDYFRRMVLFLLISIFFLIALMGLSIITAISIKGDLLFNNILIIIVFYIISYMFIYSKYKKIVKKLGLLKNDNTK